MEVNCLQNGAVGPFVAKPVEADQEQVHENACILVVKHPRRIDRKLKNAERENVIVSNTFGN